jgi:hypothetical protein
VPGVSFRLGALNPGFLVLKYHSSPGKLAVSLKRYQE